MVLCAHIERDLAPCWIAPRDVAPGVDYGTSIVQGIKGSRLVLLVFSTSANASPHVAREVTIAISNNIPIVPFCIDRTEPSGHFEYVLATPHRVLVDDGPLDAYLPKLTGWLRGMLDPAVALTHDGGEEPAAAPAALRRSVAGSGHTSTEVPELVPYLVDRREQDLQVQQLLSDAWASGTTNPLICLQHGAETECLDSFTDRIHEISIPKLLRRCERGDHVQRLDLIWPHRPDPAPTRLRRLRDELCDRLDLRPGATDAEVRQALVGFRCDVLSVTYNIHSQHWQSDEPELLSGWVRTWAGFAPLPPQQTVCVFLSFHYKGPDGFMGRWREQRVKSRIAACLASLQTESGIVPPPLLIDELVAVAQADVEDWARTHARQYCRVRDVDALVQASRELFGGGVRGAVMPMRPLVGKLRQLVAQFQG
jgi:hypothetical protein